MRYPIEVRFLDENDHLRAGELVNPVKVHESSRHVEVEFYGDNMVDVYCFRSNGEEHIYRTHVSRVASMRQVAV